jgi:hypothetical protein
MRRAYITDLNQWARLLVALTKEQKVKRMLALGQNNKIAL